LKTPECLVTKERDAFGASAAIAAPATARVTANEASAEMADFTSASRASFQRPEAALMNARRSDASRVALSSPR